MISWRTRRRLSRTRRLLRDFWDIAQLIEEDETIKMGRNKYGEVLVTTTLSAEEFTHINERRIKTWRERDLGSETKEEPRQDG